MKLQPDGSFVWKAPFHPDKPIPWLDAEHDVGPAVLQIFKDGPRQWSGHRCVATCFYRYREPIADHPCSHSIALAFELLTPTRVCKLFARAIKRKVSYHYSPTIDIEVPIPNGYREHLQGIEILFGKHHAPYFGPDLDTGDSNRTVNGADEGEGTVVEEARNLWGGWRGIEEYAREVFPLEEANNGLTWMHEKSGD